jgi:hypothetical protein
LHTTVYCQKKLNDPLFNSGLSNEKVYDVGEGYEKNVAIIWRRCSSTCLYELERTVKTVQLASCPPRFKFLCQEGIGTKQREDGHSFSWRKISGFHGTLILWSSGFWCGWQVGINILKELTASILSCSESLKYGFLKHWYPHTRLKYSVRRPRYTRQLVDRSQMDIKRKTCDIQTWKRHLWSSWYASCCV